MLIGFVVPCYNEEEVLPLFKKEADKVAEQLKTEYQADVEYVFIDDGSKDKTLEIIKKFHDEDNRVRFISFSRNFGKEVGLYAGLQATKEDLIVTMDADLQDPPSLLLEMMKDIVSGEYNCVATRRTTRDGEPYIRSFFARLFYKLINSSSDTLIMDGARDFRLMARQMVNSILEMGEYNRFSKGIFSWVGFKTKWVSYENKKRAVGKTKWNFWALYKYAIDGLVGYTVSPLMIAAWAGAGLFCISIIWIIFIVIRRLAFGDPVQGWASTVCILLFCSGIQLLGIDIIGEYLAKTYLEVKNRPIYIVKETDETKKPKWTIQNTNEGNSL